MISNWTWSFSKSSLLKNCPLAFQYSISNGKRNEQLLISMRALAGVAIHSSIQYEMDKWSKGNTISPKESIQRAIDFVTLAWNHKSDLLIEVINGYAAKESYLENTKVKVISTSPVELGIPHAFYRSQPESCCGPVTPSQSDTSPQGSVYFSWACLLTYFLLYIINPIMFQS